ncbi:hypothetical protein [Pedobacter caeni]|uniref:Uncharacterized protein n=1 Tax=Pedobacter caeni TaxID=288992 RepID=A0A1M5NR95_9SPHI|nr:hypothetical protein [Pedobacter caeni]SHG91453.1 hypothetical protein SAMN04488522_108225 [Pedobacter caeni]
MKKIEIIPLEGIDFEEGISIRFGQTIPEIKAVLGDPTAEEPHQLYYDHLEFRLDFDKNGELEFVEIQGPFSRHLAPQIYHVNPFAIEADDLVKLLTEKNDGRIDDSEKPYCYCFLENSVGVWREFVEDDIRATIDELKDNGEYEESKDWIEQDLEKAKFFWTVGIGNKNYYHTIL